MREKFQFLKYIHPFFMGLYPVLSVFGTIPGFTFADIFRFLVLIIVITGIVLFLGWKFQKINKVSIALSFSYLWFFCYYVAYNYFWQPIPLASYGIPFVYFIIFIIGIVVIIKTQRNLELLNKIFCILAIVLISLSLFPILVNAVSVQETPQPLKNTNIAGNDCYYTNLTSHKPDIYIILLDQYIGVEGQQFLFNTTTPRNLERFQQQGFKILNYHSNYDGTVLSMASLFNMNYNTSSDFENLQVLSILKNYNYTTVHVKMGYWALDNFWKTDYEYTPGLFNSFEIALLGRSFLAQPIAAYNNGEQDNSILTLTQSIVNISGPKFVYMHIQEPHHPYILNSRGEPSTIISAPLYNKNAYANEVNGTSIYTRKIITTILNQSKDEPIIIVLGDHGSRLPTNNEDAEIPNRFSALFAYSLPSYIQDPFYENMTTVNVFRTLLPATFGCNCTRLPDQSYYNGAWINAS